MLKLVLVGLLNLLSCLSFGQKKGDNTVIVKGYVSYSQIKTALFDEGFGTTNSDTLLLVTTIKNLDWGSITCYTIKRTDSSVIFKGNCKPFTVKKILAMAELAKSFNLPIVFSKEK